jgi:hypothetical protein
MVGCKLKSGTVVLNGLLLEPVKQEGSGQAKTEDSNKTPGSGYSLGSGGESNAQDTGTGHRASGTYRRIGSIEFPE